MSKLKELFLEAQEEIFEKIMETSDRCLEDCKHLERHEGGMPDEILWECTCEVETDCPRVTDKLVMARVEEKLEAFTNQLEQETEDG